jgi:hypothetical protein
MASKGLIDGLADLVSSAKVAGHIRADADVNLGGRLQVEVRVKAGDGVNFADWPFQLERQLVQLVGGEEPVASLDRSEFVEQELLLAVRCSSGRKVGHDTKPHTSLSRGALCEPQKKV